MRLSAGAQLGTYEVLSAVGAGGMGEVYRARDTRLGREVALKLLPEAFASEPERLERLEREARLLAALNHSGIATLYALEEVAGTRVLVMELVEGVTLAEKLAVGPLPVNEALTTLEQVAAALEAAHDAGILHRDLKPSNVKITPGGTVKLLDFGLGKAIASRQDADSGMSNSPTLSDETAAGVVLGTASYMSPEQARGRRLDERTDVWSFGCVLYEVLTAKKAFPGETVADALAAIVTREPDWERLPGALPRRARDLLALCLAKEPVDRLRHIGDARLALRQALRDPVAEAQSGPGSRSGRLRSALALLVTAAVAAAIGWSLKRSAPPAPRAVARLSVDLPPGAVYREDYHSPSLALSRDGTRLVYVARDDGGSRLHLRRLDQSEVSPIPGTEGAFSPFFSPDGEWIGFFTWDGRLHKVAVAGGAPRALCDLSASTYTTASWVGTRIFVGGSASIQQLSEEGCEPVAVTPGDAATGALHYAPEALPGGEALLYAVYTGSSAADAAITLHDIASGETRVLIEGGNQPHYIASGHLVYSRAGTLMAAPFDLARRRVTGAAVPVLEDVLGSSIGGFAQFALSDDGTLAFAAGGYGAPGGDDRALLWVSRDGEAEPMLEERRSYETVRFSPDGSQLALTILEGPRSNVWLYDIARGALSKLTFEKSSIFPIWSPDGARLVFSSDRDGAFNLYVQEIDGGAAQPLAQSVHFQWPDSWSRDGRVVAYTEIPRYSDSDIYVVSMEGDREARPLIASAFAEWGARFSPSGRWIAYTSDESGEAEVYVRSYPELGSRRQISVGGGGDVVWGPGDDELFYRTGQRIMRVRMGSGAELAPSRPELLFEGDYALSFDFGLWYDMAPDGRRFAMTWSEAEPPARIELILNWDEELRQRIPGG